jgi:hypothetical protein
VGMATKEDELLELAEAGDAEGLARLIDAGFNVAYQRTSDGMTALMVEAEAGHIDTVSGSQQGLPSTAAFHRVHLRVRSYLNAGPGASGGRMPLVGQRVAADDLVKWQVAAACVERGVGGGRGVLTRACPTPRPPLQEPAR